MSLQDSRNWLYKLSDTIRLTDECIGHSHGQSDCIIKAYRGDTLIGYLTYAEFEGELHIQYVEVHKDLQRQGIATQMYRKLQEDGKPINHGMSTPDGTEFVNSLS